MVMLRALELFFPFVSDPKKKKTNARGLLRFSFIYHLGVRTIIQAEGFGGVYRGVIPVMARQGANSAVRFGVYSSLSDFAKTRLNPGQQVPAVYTFGIGAIAGVITVYTTMPLDVVKTKMQGLRAKELYSGVLDCAWKVFRHEGALSFWKGATPRLARLTVRFILFYTLTSDQASVQFLLTWTQEGHLSLGHLFLSWCAYVRRVKSWAFFEGVCV